jgi:threonine dehydrogenase-like Zn-dependent dehydrogenase
MKAAVFAGARTLNVVDRTIPEPRPGWVRVAVDAVGICGSDLHIYNGAIGEPTGLQPGHEVSGVVDACGDDVDVPLGTGHDNRCTEHRLFGVTARGGMAEYLCVPAGCLHVFPTAIDRNVAALAEPMAVCVRGVRLGGIALGSRVAVLGAGTIGLLSLVAARTAGAGEVFVTARYPHQAELARALGATEVFADGAALAGACGPTSMDVVIETVGGSADTLTEAVEIAAPGASIAMLGVFDASPRFPGLPFAQRELKLVGSYCYAHDARVGDFAYATRLIAMQADALGPLVTHRFKLDEVARAYATAADKSSRSVKVQIEP